MNPNPSLAGGPAGYRGYRYQILVTVWLALKLTVATRRSDELEVEPASHEDIEALLNTCDEEASVTLGANLDGFTLTVQVKSASTQWTPYTFKNVLRSDLDGENAGASNGKRATPLERLASDPTLHFLFVTNAQLNPDLASFSIGEIGELSAATSLHGNTSADCPESSARRIGALQQMTSERLNLEIRDMLSKNAHVPPSRIEECLGKLRTEVELRLLREADPKWTGDALRETLHSCGGFPRPVDGFVPPVNFSLIESKLASGAVLVQGPPGTGKSFLRDYLEHVHRTEDIPFEVVPQSEGLAIIKAALNSPGRHLFVFDDPWGHYQLEAQASLWSAELPKLLEEATAEKCFLIVSRTTMLNTAFPQNVPGILKDIAVELLVADYTDESRREILRHHLKGAKQWQLELAEQEETRIVHALREPYSLRTFARNLKRLASDGSVRIDQLVEKSKIETIGVEFAEEIRQHGSHGLASGIVLWTLLMTHGRISAEKAKEAGDDVESGGFTDPCDPLELFTWLNRSERLTPADDQFTLHPTLLQGLETLFNNPSSAPQKVITARLNALAAQDKGEEIEGLSKLISSRNLRTPPAAQNVLNAYLLVRVTTEDRGWRYAFSDLVKFSKAIDPVTSLLKLLAPTRSQKHRFAPAFEEWSPPDVDQEAADGIKASGDAKDAARRYITDYLPDLMHSRIDAGELCGFLARFGWDFTEDFCATLIDCVGHDRHIDLDLFIPAALQGPSPQYDQLIGSIAAGLPGPKEPTERGRELVRQADQEEIDAAWAARIQEPDESGWQAWNALGILVARRRASEGYQWIADHPSRDKLLLAWQSAIESSAEAGELASLRAACGDDLEPYWRAAAKSPAEGTKALLIEDFKSAPAKQLGVLIKAWEKLQASVHPTSWYKVLQPVLDLGRKLEILETSLDDEAWCDLDTSPALGLFNADELPGIRRLLKSVGAKNREIASALDDDERAFLETIASSGPEHLSLPALAALGLQDNLDGQALIRLQSSSQWRVRCGAAGLVASEKPAGWRDTILKLLDDPDYRCRHGTILALAPDATAEEKARILECANDKSAPVREACAQAIGEHGWEDGRPILLKLCRDRHNDDNSAHFAPRSGTFTVARAAATSLGQLPSPVDKELEQIETLAGDLCKPPGNDAEKDPAVAHTLLVALAGHHPRLTGLFLKHLENPWYAESYKNSGFTIRIAAAWGIFTQLDEFSEQRQGFNPEVLRKGATATDHRLAGPCLAALCLLGSASTAQLLSVSQKPEFDEYRALVVKLYTPLLSKAVVEAVANSLDPKAPGTRLLDWLLNNGSATASSFQKFLDEQEGIADWLTTLPKQPASAELRSLLVHRWPVLLNDRIGLSDLVNLHHPEHIRTLRLG